MKIIIAIDSFKGCLSSAEANEAAKAGVLQALPSAEVITMPVSDGGEGWLDAVHHAIGGKYHMSDAVDPLLRPIRVPYLFHRESRTAYVESAKVIGMGLLVERHRQCPSYLWSCGMADLLVKIWKAHPRCHIVVGLGGSATCDAGIGMMMYLEEDDRKWHFRDTTLPSFTIAYDVANPLCGPTGAARMFAPQKGATTHEVEILERRAAITAIRWKRMRNGRDCSNLPGAGAAGGLGYAFMQWMDADNVPGIDLWLQLSDFARKAEDADLVITGEGSADRQTLLGKVPFGILKAAKAAHKAANNAHDEKKKRPALWLIAGRVQDQELLTEAGFDFVKSINPPNITLDQAMKKENAIANIKNTIQQLM